jgi:hypothetical protein
MTTARTGERQRQQLPQSTWTKRLLGVCAANDGQIHGARQPQSDTTSARLAYVRGEDAFQHYHARER